MVTRRCRRSHHQPIAGTTGIVAVALTLFVFATASGACGGGSDVASSSTDGGGSGSDGGGGADGSQTTSTQCKTPTFSVGSACTEETACCLVDVADGFGPDPYRCSQKTWKVDTTCLPAPPACKTPLTGKLSRADGSSVAVTCFGTGGQNGVASIALTLEGTAEILEIRFDRAPAANDVLNVIAFTQGPNPDAGTFADGGSENQVELHIGQPGGFSGFAESAKSASGKLTVTSIEASSPTVITSLHGSIDVQLTGSAPWAGKLTGSW